MDKTGEDSDGLHLMGKFGKRWPTFFQIYDSVYIKMSFTQQENHSQLLCGLDFANERPSPFKKGFLRTVNGLVLVEDMLIISIMYAPLKGS